MNHANSNLPSRKLAEAQSRWLQSARSRLLRRAAISQRRSIVDLGSGWGQISSELQERSGGHVYAVDRRPAGFIENNNTNIEPILADGSRLPLADNCCDLVFCQCMLMWVDDPRAVIQEALRILAPGGALTAIEPDYGGMMEYPDEVATKTIWIDALRRAGADPFVGRKLPHLITELGCSCEVQFFDRLEPPTDTRFDLLLELPLTTEERQQVDRARLSSASAEPAPTAHLPFWMVHCET